jgi:hypothetical protein
MFDYVVHAGHFDFTNRWSQCPHTIPTTVSSWVRIGRTSLSAIEAIRIKMSSCGWTIAQLARHVPKQILTVMRVFSGLGL